MNTKLVTYDYKDCELSGTTYLLPLLKKIVQGHTPSGRRRLFDLGCGNGSMLNFFRTIGFEVNGVDPSSSGVGMANSMGLPASIGSTDDDLSEVYGTYDVVLSVNVLAHVVDPFRFKKVFLELIADDGIGIIVTPYHGYVKNLFFSIFNLWDKHFSTLWGGSYVKFYSRDTLNQLMSYDGFKSMRFYYAGRFFPLSKSMILVVKK